MQSTASAPSTVGSVQGPVIIVADNTYRQSGSNLWALQNDAVVLAKKIEISGSPETEQGSTYSRFKQSGLTLSISSPVIGIAQTASSLADAAGNTSNTRMQALAAAAAAAALNIHAQRKALQALASGKAQDMGPGLGLDLSLGSSSSQSASAYSAAVATAAGSMVSGGTAIGATTAFNSDINNRHLHQTEIQWIKSNSKRYAKQQNISPNEAEQRLAKKAFRQVQFGEKTSLPPGMRLRMRS